MGRNRYIASALGIAALAGTLLLGAGASATEPVEAQFQASSQGPAGDITFSAGFPAVAYNTTNGDYLVVWSGDVTAGESEIFARVFGPDRSPLTAPLRISSMGPDGNDDYSARAPAATYNPVVNEYFVVWSGNDATAASVFNSGGTEIHAQRLSAAGEEVGSDDLLLSDTGPADSLTHNAFSPDVVYNTTRNEYLVAWTANDTIASNMFESGDQSLYVQRVSADGTEIDDEVDISDTASSAFNARSAAVAYNSRADEYLVAWSGNVTVPDTFMVSDGDYEVRTRRLDGTATPLAPDVVLSEMGPDGSDAYDAINPDVAYNSTANEYLVVWQGDDDEGELVDNKFEIYAQRVSSDGAQIGPADIRISQSGLDTEIQFSSSAPAIAANPLDNQYLVAWSGPDLDLLDAAVEPEIYGHTLSATGAKIGAGRPRKISSMGDGEVGFQASIPAVVHSRVTNEYLVAWFGDDNTGGRVDNEFEVWARAFGGGGAAGEGLPGTVTPGTPAAPNCVALAPAPAPSNTPGTLTLSPAQLKINQRIGQAAIRRAAAIQNWLDAGIVNSDLCGGGLTGTQLDPGVAYAQGILQEAPAKADPRALAIAPAAAKTGVVFEVTPEQLQINQRVYAAAVRRANALQERVAGKLTGGDITDGQLTSDRLRQDLIRGALSPAASPPGASQTVTAPASSSPANFTPTVKQLRINQKIAQAAVRRTNTLRRTLATGLTGENFADGSITAVDFAP